MRNSFFMRVIERMGTNKRGTAELEKVLAVQSIIPVGLVHN